MKNIFKLLQDASAIETESIDDIVAKYSKIPKNKRKDPWGNFVIEQSDDGTVRANLAHIKKTSKTKS